MEIPGTFATILAKAISILSKPEIRIGTRNGVVYASLEFDEIPKQTLDERIAKIDAARANLAEALNAIDELKLAANANKEALSTALERLTQTQTEHNAAKLELDLVRQVASSDIETFQRLAGVPSKAQVVKERVIGFLLGVIASVLASFAWWLIVKAIPYFDV